jgi:HK97 family phage portal protein
MRLFGWEVTRPRADAQMTLDQLIQRLDAMFATVSGISVTPESAMQAPTVQAIVQAVAGAISTLTVRVLQKTTKAGRTSKEPLPNHPVDRLLLAPNDTEDRVTYWLDATSWLIRYGNHYAVKGRGITGPIRRLVSIPPGEVSIEQQQDRTLLYRIGTEPKRTAAQMHHVRGAARNGWEGDSPVMDVREAIALEIAAERFGAAFFGNGALPLLIFKYAVGSQGHKSPAARQQFLDEFQSAFKSGKAFKGFLLPHGMDTPETVEINNDHAQFLDTRKLQRTIIAGAFGVPPHMVGDLERATFSNIEHQSLEFVQRVVLPKVRVFEGAMERDLLTPEDRAQGVIIRFNMDALLRGDFKSRQDGLNIQRQAGVINANEWREHEDMNPRTDVGGEHYWDEGPSGQGAEPNKDPAADPEQPAGNGNGDGNATGRPASARRW